jgi:hypothetical protein
MNALEQNTQEELVAHASLMLFVDGDAPAWMKAVHAIRGDRQGSGLQAIDCKILPKGCGRRHSVLRNTASPQDVRERETSDSDNNLGIDFAKAAVSTGSQAFDSSDWDEKSGTATKATSDLM